MTEPHETYDWLKASELADWVLKRLDGGEMLHERSPNLARAVSRWKTESTAVSVYDADRLLTPFDIHLWEIPDSFWMEKRRNKRSAKYLLVEEMLKEGYSVDEVINHLRFSGSRVRRDRVNSIHREIYAV